MKNTGDTADAVTLRIEQVEDQNAVLKNRFVIATVIAVISLFLAVASLVVSLMMESG